MEFWLNDDAIFGQVECADFSDTKKGLISKFQILHQGLQDKHGWKLMTVQLMVWFALVSMHNRVDAFSNLPTSASWLVCSPAMAINYLASAKHKSALPII